MIRNRWSFVIGVAMMSWGAIMAFGPAVFFEVGDWQKPAVWVAVSLAGVAIMGSSITPIDENDED